jgi:hypothetical protein
MKTFALLVGVCSLALGWSIGSERATAEAQAIEAANAQIEAEAEVDAEAAAALPPPDSVITLSDEVRDECEAEGGCRLISLKTAIEKIDAEAKRRAGNCMGGAIYRPDI